MNLSAVRPGIVIALVVALLALVLSMLLPLAGAGASPSVRGHSPAVSYQAGNWCC